MDLSSTTLIQLAPTVTEFGRIPQNYRHYAVQCHSPDIQSYRFWYHLKSIGLCDFLLVNNTKVGLYLVQFPSYCKLFVIFSLSTGFTCL